MKKAYLLLLFLSSLFIIPTGGQSTNIPEIPYFETLKVTLENNGSFEGLISYNEFRTDNMRFIVNQSLGDGKLEFFFFSDETFNVPEIPENATFLYDLNGTQYFRLPNNESVVYREIAATGKGINKFYVARDWRTINEAGLSPDWKMMVVYNGEGLAKFDMVLLPANQVDIVYYQELSLTDTVPTILDYVEPRYPQNLTIGLVGAESSDANLTVVWTTKNITSDVAPEDFMENPFTYTSSYSGKPEVAYNGSSGISLVRTVNLTKQGETLFLDHPYFTKITEYQWNVPYKATPFHLLFFVDEPVTVWFHFSKWYGDYYPTYGTSAPSSSSSSTTGQEESPVSFEGMALGLFVSVVALKTIGLKKKRIF